MKKFMSFIKQIYTSFNENELLYMSSELTYKLLLAFFPLLMYTINLLTFFGLKYEVFESSLMQTLPDTIQMIFTNFLDSVTNFAELNNFSSIMNLTLIFAIISSSSGFLAIIRGINRTYGVKDERGFIHKKLLSIALVFLFSFTLVVTGVFFIFIDVLIDFLFMFGIDIVSSRILNYAMTYFPVLLILITVMLVYKISCYKKIRFKKTLPGAFITVFAWIIISNAYNFYINNFSKFSTLYGVIGSFIIFMLWINTISIAILFGSQVNALLDKDE